MKLFTPPKKKFEKSASTTELSDNIDNWSSELTNELYTQLPFTSGKEIEINLNNINEDNRSALGTARIAEGKKEIAIPIIIKEGLLSPFDTAVVNGKMIPASEQSVNEYFFEPALFENKLLRRDKGGTNSPLDTSLYPFGLESPVWGADARSTFYGKVASTLSQKSVDELIKKLSEDQDINDYVVPKLNEIKDLIPKIKKTASKEEEVIDAMVMFREDGGTVKSIGLRRDPFKFYVYDNVLDKVASKITDEPILIGSGEGLIEPTKLEKKTGFGVIPGYGEGFLFTKVATLDGNEVDSDLFIGDDIYGYGQDLESKIYNESITKENPIAGKGIFYYDNKGETVATPIIEVDGIVKDEVQAHYLGDLIKLSLSDKIVSPVKLNEGHYLLPKTAKFMKVAGKMSDIAKTPKEHLNASNMVTMTLTSEGFKFKGEPVNSVSLPDLPEKVASLVLVGLGASANQARDLVTFTKTYGQPSVIHTNKVFTPEDETLKKTASLKKKVAETIKVAMYDELAELYKYINEKPVQEFIKKAAGATPAQSEETVDTLLSLDFMNDDNMESFVDNLPKLKECASILSSLLIASRLGITGLPEKAVASTIRNLVKVIKALSVMRDGVKSSKK